MFRLYRLVLVGAAVVVAGCTRATFGFRPTLTSQVPDSTVVRVRAANGQPPITGRSLDWQIGRPRIVTVSGDTVIVPELGLLEVRLKAKRSYATVGGVVGVAAGFGIALAKCPAGIECRPTLTPAITGGIGALIGSRFFRHDWVAVKRTTR